MESAATVALSTDICANAPIFTNRDEFILTVISQPQVIDFIEKLSLNPSNNKLFVESLCHTSFVNEYKNLDICSNERLEFLGDSILNFYVTQKLFAEFSDLSEGELSKMRGGLVNEEKLQEVAQLIGLSNVILTGRGETRKQGYMGAAVMADAFESLLGYLYLDGGIDSVFQFMDQLLLRWEQEKERPFLDLDILEFFDAKTKLQERTMAMFKELPDYKSIQEGESFEVTCYVQGKALATIEGPSKKKAQRQLAEKILKENLLDIFQEDKDVN